MRTRDGYSCDACRKRINGEVFMRKGKKRMIHVCSDDCNYKILKGRKWASITEEQEFKAYEKVYWKRRLGSKLVLPGDMEFTKPEDLKGGAQ